MLGDFSEALPKLIWALGFPKVVGDIRIGGFRAWVGSEISVKALRFKWLQP